MLRPRIKFISVDEFSVKLVGSVINCFMLYFCIRSFILLLTLSMFMLKSPRTLISYVGAISHVDTFINGGKIVCITVRGSVKPSDEDFFLTVFESQPTQPLDQGFPGQFEILYDKIGLFSVFLLFFFFFFVFFFIFNF